MFPVLFEIGPFTLYTYGAFIAAGFLGGYLLLCRQARLDKIPDAFVSDLVWVLLLGGLVGARVLYVLFDWTTYRDAPLDILKIWQGGLVFYGGLIGGVVAGVIFTRRRGGSILQVADVVAPGLALGQAIGRLGCFAAGCCYGEETDLPWAIIFTATRSLAPTDIPLHPSQLYESGLALILCIALVMNAGRIRSIFGAGGIALLYVEGYSVIRLAVESTRGDVRGPVFLNLTSTQWIALALLIAASAGNFFLLIKHRRSTRQ